MAEINNLAVQSAGPKDLLARRSDFKSYAQDVSNAVMSAMERRHLEYLNLTSVPPPARLNAPGPGELRFLKVERIGHSPQMDRSLDVLNFQNVLGTFRDGGYTFVAALSADSVQNHLYLGARSKESGPTTAYDFIHNFRRALEGNLPGTALHKFRDSADELICPDDDVLQNIHRAMHEYSYLAAVTGIPSLRAESDQQYAQSLDRLIQSLQGQQYLVLIIAEPVSNRQIDDMLQNSLRLGTEVHSWVRISASYAQAIGDAVAKGRSEGKVTNQSEAESYAKSVSKGTGKQPGAVMGGLLGAAVGLALSPIMGPAGIGIGGMASSMVSGIGGSAQDGVSDSETTSRTKSWGDSVTDSLTNTSSKTETSSVNVEYLNKTAELCESIVDGYVQRLNRGKNLGMWNVGLYFFADEPATFAQGRAQLRSLYAGKDSYLEPMRTIDLSASRNVRHNIGAVLGSFSNPVLDLRDPETNEPLRHPLGNMHQALSTPINTEELALILNLPRREVPGLKLELVADFGVNPKAVDSERSIILGNVLSGGTQLPIPIGIDKNDLTRHAFITGITGGGKTNTCFALLKAAAERVPFLVIEPVKSEYRQLLNDPAFQGMRIYTLGDETLSPFRINPFQFVPGSNLVTHIDYLKSIFNASFPMYAAMPYILEEALVDVYQDRGWDLADSTNPHLDMNSVIDSWREGKPDYSYTRHLPTLSSLYKKIDDVVNRKGYAQEITQNYSASLKARIRSLMLGAKGKMLDTQFGIPLEDLFGFPTVIEMKSMGDDDEKCFLMGLLLTLLYEYREQQYRLRPQSGLRHLTVLEESHRLLGNVGQSGSAEAANPRGKAVETFANMLAEIREYGEGFMIVDQTPSKLIPDAIKNTSTKIIHRLAARDDREMVGESIGITEDQQQMLPRLRVGEAVVYTQDQDKAILTKIAPSKTSGGTTADEAVKASMAPIQKERADMELRRAMQHAESVASRLRNLASRIRNKTAANKVED